jgi:hypothetical protein
MNVLAPKIGAIQKLPKVLQWRFSSKWPVMTAIKFQEFMETIAVNNNVPVVTSGKQRYAKWLHQY